VVLREPEIYKDGFPKPGSKQDVDLLLDDAGQKAVEEKYGKGFKWRGVKCDIYSLSGEGKGAYHEHPYFPVRLGQSILDNRRMYEGMFYIPAAADHFHSLLYHIAYQKAEGSKVGFDDPEPITKTKYYKPLDLLAKELGVEMPMTLRQMHEYLQSVDLAIPMDWLRLAVMEAFKH
jgi:hypothetical protein